MVKKVHLSIKSIFESYYLDLQRFLTYKYSDRNDAEDIAQEAFHNILKSDRLEELDNPKAYLYQTASNLALNRIRKEKLHRDYIVDCGLVEDVELSPERTVSAQKELDLLQQGIERLPEKYRRTFILSRVHAKTYPEISEELGIAVSTVEKHIIKALRFLREELEGKADK